MQLDAMIARVIVKRGLMQTAIFMHLLFVIINLYRLS